MNKRKPVRRRTGTLGVADPIQDTSTASNAALLRALQEREAKLEEREHEVKNRMQAINLAELEIQEQLKALVDAEEALKSTIALADSIVRRNVPRIRRRIPRFDARRCCSPHNDRAGANNGILDKRYSRRAKCKRSNEWKLTGYQ